MYKILYIFIRIIDEKRHLVNRIQLSELEKNVYKYIYL